jgi:hypothetical protein
MERALFKNPSASLPLTLKLRVLVGLLPEALLSIFFLLTSSVVEAAAATTGRRILPAGDRDFAAILLIVVLGARAALVELRPPCEEPRLSARWDLPPLSRLDLLFARLGAGGLIRSRSGGVVPASPLLCLRLLCLWASLLGGGGGAACGAACSVGVPAAAPQLNLRCDRITARRSISLAAGFTSF